MLEEDDILEDGEIPEDGEITDIESPRKGHTEDDEMLEEGEIVEEEESLEDGEIPQDVEMTDVESTRKDPPQPALTAYIAPDLSTGLFAKQLHWDPTCVEKSKTLAKFFHCPSMHSSQKTAESVLSSAFLFGVLMQLGLRMPDSPVLISTSLLYFTEAQPQDPEASIHTLMFNHSTHESVQKLVDFYCDGIQSFGEDGLFSLRDLAVLASADNIPEPWISYRESLRKCIFDIEVLHFHNVCTLGEHTPVWSEHSPSASSFGLPGLQRQCLWLPAVPHVGYLISNIAFSHDGRGNFAWQPATGATASSLSKPVLYGMPSYFTSKPGSDAPTKPFNRDGTFIYEHAKNADSLTFPLGKKNNGSAHPCAAHVDGTPLCPPPPGYPVELHEGFRDKVTDELLADVPFTLSLGNISQLPYIMLRMDIENFLTGAKLVLHPETCAYFNVRTLLLPNEVAQSLHTGPFSRADHLELLHQWPVHEFRSRKRTTTSELALVFEFVAVKGEGSMFQPANYSDETQLRASMNATTRGIWEKLLNAQTVRLAVIVSGALSQGEFEWFKRLISAGRTLDQQHFHSLWAYFEREDTGVRQSALRFLKIDTEGPESYPKVPSYLVKSWESGEAVTLLKLKMPPQYASIEQLVAILAIGTSRAIQHERLGHQSLIHADHKCLWLPRRNEHGPVATIYFYVRLQTAALHRDLPQEGNEMTLSLSPSTTSYQRPGSYAPSRVLSVSGEIESTGLLKDGINLIVRCSLNPSVVSQLRDLAPSNQTLSAKLSFNQSSSDLFGQLSALRRLLEYVPRPGTFDLKARILGQSPTTTDTFAAGDFSSIASKGPTMTPELLQGWYDFISFPLDQFQRSPYWASLHGLTCSYGHILGPPGSGKSRTAASIIAAVAATKKVLAVAQTNDCLDDLLDKIPAILKQVPAILSPIRRSIAVCRYYSRSAQQTKPGLCVFKNPPENPREIKSDLRDLLFGDYSSTTCSDVAMDRLVHLSAVHAAGSGSQQDEAVASIVTQYMDSYSGLQNQMASSAQVGGKTHSATDFAAGFDSARQKLSEQLLAGLDIVFATIDQSASLLEVFDPQLVVLEECNQINLPQGITPLVQGHRPEALLTIGDKMQLGPVVPSALSGFNEMAVALTKPFIEHLEPSQDTQCFALRKNYRNPASIWEFPREQYKKKGVEVESAVDVKSIPLLRQLRETTTRHGTSFLRGVLDRFDLHKNQQVWFDIASCPEVPYAPGKDRSPDPNPQTIFTHDNEHLEYIRRYPAAKVNYGGVATTCRTVRDLLDLMKVEPADVLVQATTADDAEVLERCIHRINPQVAVRSVNKSLSGESAIVVTHLNACACDPNKDARQSVPSNPTMNVALTRAKVFHIIIGNAACIQRDIKFHADMGVGDQGKWDSSTGGPWVRGFLHHVVTNIQLVRFPTNKEDIRLFVEPELGPKTSA
ncbi:hypothetical protein KC318_g4337 [Hortaea werneckii]|nr:hypothetical protein KC334_g4079 [Hortaea werneckii]KAI7025186.1 hypothetical protein KC355_g1135 [Hortaea werneckii]KAI7669909.1 hypothetical protein KC318_g4337 [Hortaea werneckii]